MKYGDKLKDPRWQKKRLEIMQRDEWKCQFCGESNSTLAVHHTVYQYGKDPWEHHEENLVTICEQCHQSEYESRKESEEQLLEILKIYRFTASDVHELYCIIGRHMPERPIKVGTPADFLTLIDRMLCWRKADEKRNNTTT